MFPFFVYGTRIQPHTDDLPYYSKSTRELQEKAPMILKLQDCIQETSIEIKTENLKTKSVHFMFLKKIFQTKSIYREFCACEVLKTLKKLVLIQIPQKKNSW